MSDYFNSRHSLGSGALALQKRVIVKLFSPFVSLQDLQ